LSWQQDVIPLGHASVNSRWQALWSYSLAVILVIATFLLRDAVSVSFNERPLLILFMFPIIVSALSGGFGPGITATLMAAASTAYFLVPPRGSFGIAQGFDLFQWGMLGVNGVLVSLLSEALHRSRLREKAKWRQLDATQNLLQQSERRFEANFELAAVGIAMVAPNGQWLRVNSKLCDILGYRHEELLALTFQAITHPDDLSDDLIQVSRMLAREIPTYSIEKRYIRKDGSLVWINLTVSLVWKPDSTPDYFISVLEDIEARKQAEAALKASEAALKSAQRLAGLGNWEWDLRNGTHQWSEEIYAIYGRDPVLPPADYQEVQKYFTPESWRDLALAVELGLKDGRAYECDAEVVRPDGSRRWIVARGDTTKDADGQVVFMHGTVQDITGRKHAEEEIRRLNAELEKRVLDRTAELSHANQELDCFVYAVSHDLRSPLRAMSGFSQALIEDFSGQFPEEAQIYLDQIDLASRKMSDLIDGLLELSRCTRGELSCGEVDLSTLSDRLLAEFSRNEPDRKVDTDVESGLKVHSDARMMESVMRNLLGNAWKYSAHADIGRIRVYAEHRDGVCRICVADNGAGFDMAYASKLFQPFQRLHRQDEFPGIGIGLATVQRIVHRQGGVIEAQSESGKGAVFCFTLSGSHPETEKSQSELL